MKRLNPFNKQLKKKENSLMITRSYFSSVSVLVNVVTVSRVLHSSWISTDNVVSSSSSNTGLTGVVLVVFLTYRFSGGGPMAKNGE